MTANMSCVIDANVIIPTFIEEPDSAAARHLFAIYATQQPITIAVPDCFYAETGQVLWKHRQFKTLTTERYRESVLAIAALPLSVTSTRELLPVAVRLNIHYQLNFIDACYLALAMREQLPLITLDGGFRNATRQCPVPVYTVQDFLELYQLME